MSWDCAKCGHQHAGQELANICIGCPCPETKPDMNGDHRGGGSAAKMKFTVDKEAFAKELSLVLGVMDEPDEVSAPAYVLIESKDESELAIIGTDLDVDISLSAGCLATVQEAGAIVLPAQKLLEIVEALPGPTIVFSTKPESDCVVIRSGCANFELLGIDRKHCRSTPQAGEYTGTLSSSVLQLLIGRTVYAAIEEQSRYRLDGVSFSITLGVLRFVATDGHRLAIASAELQTPIVRDLYVILPQKGLAQLDVLLQERSKEIADIQDQRDADFNGDVEFCVDDECLFFRVGTRALALRKLSGNFPNYELVIPKNHDRFITLETRSFIDALERMVLMADERSQAVWITASDHALRFSAYHNDFGKAEESFAVDYASEPMNKSFRAEYLLEFLRTVTDERFILAFDSKGEERSAVTLIPETETGYTYVVMPIRSL